MHCGLQRPGSKFPWLGACRVWGAGLKRVQDLRFRVRCFGVWRSGFRVWLWAFWGLGFRVWGLGLGFGVGGFRLCDLGANGSELGVLGFWVQGLELGFRVWGCGLWSRTFSGG